MSPSDSDVIDKSLSTCIGYEFQIPREKLEEQDIDKLYSALSGVVRRLGYISTCDDKTSKTRKMYHLREKLCYMFSIIPYNSKSYDVIEKQIHHDFPLSPEFSIPARTIIVSKNQDSVNIKYVAKFMAEDETINISPPEENSVREKIISLSLGIEYEHCPYPSLLEKWRRERKSAIKISIKSDGSDDIKLGVESNSPEQPFWYKYIFSPSFKAEISKQRRM